MGEWERVGGGELGGLDDGEAVVEKQFVREECKMVSFIYMNCFGLFVLNHCSY